MKKTRTTSKLQPGDRVTTNAAYSVLFAPPGMPCDGTVVRAAGDGRWVVSLPCAHTMPQIMHERFLNKREDGIVMELKSKTVAHKGGGFEWVPVAKDEWHGVVPNGQLPPRIRQLDGKTFCCYRDGKYLGSEASMALAFERIKSNHQSDKNVALAIWQKKYPDELPPFLALTDAERAEYWRHSGVQARAPSRGSPQQYKTPEQKAAASAGFAESRVDKKEHAAARAEHKPKPTTRIVPKEGKRAEVLALLRRKEGCTRDEVLRVTGWKAVSMQEMAKSLGVGLRVEKDAKPFRYHAE